MNKAGISAPRPNPRRDIDVNTNVIEDVFSADTQLLVCVCLSVGSITVFYRSNNLPSTSEQG